MSTASTDRRVRRTRELLRSALLSLIQEKGYDRITVQDILDRADIGRSTFYAHYRDKDDLFRAGFEDIRAALAAERDAAEQGTGRRPSSSSPCSPSSSTSGHTDTSGSPCRGREEPTW